MPALLDTTAKQIVTVCRQMEQTPQLCAKPRKLTMYFRMPPAHGRGKGTKTQPIRLE